MNVGGLTLWFGSPAFIQILNIFQFSCVLRHLCIWTICIWTRHLCGDEPICSSL